MTQSDTSEYAWNPQTTVSLTEPSPDLCLITDELSPDKVVQGDQHLNFYVNSMIGPPTFAQLDHSSHMILSKMKLFINQNQIGYRLIKHKNAASFIIVSNSTIFCFFHGGIIGPIVEYWTHAQQIEYF